MQNMIAVERGKHTWLVAERKPEGHFALVLKSNGKALSFDTQEIAQKYIDKKDASSVAESSEPKLNGRGTNKTKLKKQEGR